jgi:hypothetical protein
MMMKKDIVFTNVATLIAATFAVLEIAKSQIKKIT